MPTVSACPNAQTIEQLRKGQLPLPEVEAVTRHLETCARCAETVPDLHLEDPLFDAVCGQAARQAPAESPVLEELIQRLRGRRGVASGNETSTACQTEVPGSPPSDDRAMEAKRLTSWRRRKSRVN